MTLSAWKVLILGTGKYRFTYVSLGIPRKRGRLPEKTLSHIKTPRTCDETHVCIYNYIYTDIGIRSGIQTTRDLIR